jgi:hypothetical protein
MEAEPNKNNVVTQNFYWCFFELSNGAIIDVHYTENYDDNGEDIGDEYIISYQEDYSFNLSFREWFEGTFKKPAEPFFEVLVKEYDLVKEYYIKNIYNNRENKTGVIEL